MAISMRDAIRILFVITLTILFVVNISFGQRYINSSTTLAVDNNLKYNNYAESIQDGADSIEQDQQNVRTLYENSLNLLINNEYQKAINSFGKVIDLLNENPYGQNQRVLEGALYNKALGLWMLHQLDESLKSINEAIRLDQDDADAWLLKGRIEYEKNNFMDSKLALDKAIQIDNFRGIGIAWFNEGLVNYALGNYDESIRSYYLAIEYHANVPASWNNIGTALCAKGKYKEALEKYNKAIDAYYRYPEAYYNKGLVLQQLGNQEMNASRYEEAIDFYNIAIDLRNNYTYALNNKGIALLALNRSAQANEVFIKVRALELNFWHKAIVFIIFFALYTTLFYGYIVLRRRKSSKELDIFSINIFGFFA
jgi:tetratricopeptide (TPR) repeat protein